MPALEVIEANDLLKVSAQASQASKSSRKRKASELHDGQAALNAEGAAAATEGGDEKRQKE